MSIGESLNDNKMVIKGPPRGKVLGRVSEVVTSSFWSAILGSSGDGAAICGSKEVWGKLFPLFSIDKDESKELVEVRLGC
jgi:hypothetical protein